MLVDSGGALHDSMLPSNGQFYLLHNTLRDVNVLHGHDLRQFIQAVDILDLIQELHAEIEIQQQRV